MKLINPAYNNKTINNIANINSLTYKCEIKNTKDNKDTYGREYLYCCINIDNSVFKEDIIDYNTFKYLINYPQDFNSESGKKTLHPNRGIVDYPEADYVVEDYSINDMYLDFLDKMKVLIEIDYHKFAILIGKMIGTSYIPSIDELNELCLTKDYEVIDNKVYETVITKSGKEIQRVVSNKMPEGYKKKFIENYEKDIISLNRTEDIVRFYLRPAVIGLYK